MSAEFLEAALVQCEVLSVESERFGAKLVLGVSASVKCGNHAVTSGFEVRDFLEQSRNRAGRVFTEGFEGVAVVDAKDSLHGYSNLSAYRRIFSLKNDLSIIAQIE